MTKPAFILLPLLFMMSFSFGQKIHYVRPAQEKITIPGRNFYIEKVVDQRYSKDNLGWVQEGLFNTKIPVDFENSFVFTLSEYFDEFLPGEEGQAPISMVFKVLKVSEETASKRPAVYADLRVEFYFNDTQLFSTDQHVENSGADINILLENSLREILAKSLAAFGESPWREKIADDAPQNVIGNKFKNPDYAHYMREEEAPEEGPITYTEEELKEMIPENRDVFAVGFGLGGINLVGMNYEARVSDLFGIHGGMGYLATDFFGKSYFSYTAGLKIHTGETKNHSFFNLSYKDAGFGLLGMAAVEFGDRVVFSKKRDFGMLYQAGLGVVTNMDDDLQPYFEDETVSISAGIGLSFNIFK